MTELDPIKKFEEFGRKLRELRKARNLTQKKLAEMLTNEIRNLGDKESSVEEGRISRWETSTPYKGRHWFPNSEQVLGLIRIFVGELTLKDALNWVRLLNYEFSHEVWESIFDEERQKPFVTYVKRKKFEEEIKTALTSSEKPEVLVLCGIGGNGKTALVQWVEKNLQSYFKDGIIFVDNRKNLPITRLLDNIAELVGYEFNSQLPSQRKRELSNYLLGKEYLIIIDHLWAETDNTTDLHDILVGNRLSPVLITTRDSKVITVLEVKSRVESIEITGLSEEEGFKLLEVLGWNNKQDPETVKRLMDRVNYSPLAITLIAAQLKDNNTPAKILSYFPLNKADLDAINMDSPDSPTQSLELCFDLSYERLKDPKIDMQKGFAQLGCFFDSFDEQAAVDVLNLEPGQVEKILIRLRRFALLKKEGEQYQIHRLIRYYALKKLSYWTVEEKDTFQRHAEYYFRKIAEDPSRGLDWIQEFYYEFEYGLCSQEEYFIKLEAKLNATHPEIEGISLADIAAAYLWVEKYDLPAQIAIYRGCYQIKKENKQLSLEVYEEGIKKLRELTPDFISYREGIKKFLAVIFDGRIPSHQKFADKVLILLIPKEKEELMEQVEPLLGPNTFSNFIQNFLQSIPLINPSAQGHALHLMSNQVIDCVTRNLFYQKELFRIYKVTGDEGSVVYLGDIPRISNAAKQGNLLLGYLKDWPPSFNVSFTRKPID